MRQAQMGRSFRRTKPGRETLAAGYDMPSAVLDWPDLLAATLSGTGDVAFSRWATIHGLANATVSRGFKAVYGVSPSAFRLELKVRRAWRTIVRGTVPLAQVALEAGFADHAHMTRAVHRFSGFTPSLWRAMSVAAGPKVPKKSLNSRTEPC
jgi:AraC-like DNA-binding protein